MPRELTFITPTVEDLIGRSTVGEPRRIRKKSRASGLPRLKLENGYYIPRPAQVSRRSGFARKLTLPIIGGFAAAMLAFSAGARYEWRKADNAFIGHPQHSEVARPGTISARLARGKIQNPVTKPKNIEASAVPAGSSPLKDASNPPAREMAVPQAPIVTPLFLPSAPTIGLRPAETQASDTISIPPIPSILSARPLVARAPEVTAPVTRPASPAHDRQPEGRSHRTRDSGVHVSLLSGQHEQPPLNLAVPSGVDVSLLPRPVIAPEVGAASAPIQQQTASPETAWRVVTVLGHGVVIQRNGQPMQIVKIGDRLPDGSTLSSVNPGIGQWESDRSSSKPTKPTKDVDHGIATSKSQ